jgi:hypothetical protein
MRDLELIVGSVQHDFADFGARVTSGVAVSRLNTMLEMQRDDWITCEGDVFRQSAHLGKLFTVQPAFVPKQIFPTPEF